jgi:hypothetical protein
LGRVGGWPSDPATAIGAPRVDPNRGFRVGRSIFDAKRHAGVFLADSKGSIDEPRAADHRAYPIRQRVALGRVADKIGVETAIIVFVVIGTNSIVLLSHKNPTWCILVYINYKV